MVPISKSDLGNFVSTVENFWKASKYLKPLLKNVDGWISKEIGSYFPSCKNLHELISLNPTQIKDLVLTLDKEKTKDPHFQVPPFTVSINGQDQDAFLYCYDKSRKLRKSVIDSHSIDVCPFCNRNWIFSGKNATAELDHFYPKSKYPFLACSYFNLIPVCHTCNHLKGDTIFSYNPLLERNTADFDFLYIPDNDKGQIKEYMSDSSYEIQFSRLELGFLYSHHTDTVKELIGFCNFFNSESYKESSQKRQVFNDFRSDFFSSILRSESFVTTPLLKLKQDILKEILQKSK